MAQDYTTRQTSWQSRWGAAVGDLLRTSDRLSDLVTEWQSLGLATGASPTAANITDAVCQQTFPCATALMLNQAEGAVAGANAILPTIAANRGYLEPFRA